MVSGFADTPITNQSFTRIVENKCSLATSGPRRGVELPRGSSSALNLARLSSTADGKRGDIKSGCYSATAARIRPRVTGHDAGTVTGASLRNDANGRRGAERRTERLTIEGHNPKTARERTGYRTLNRTRILTGSGQPLFSEAQSLNTELPPRCSPQRAFIDVEPQTERSGGATFTGITPTAPRCSG